MYLKILGLFSALLFFSSIENSQFLQELKINHAEAIEKKDNIKIAEYLEKIANYYWENDNYEEAISFFKKLLETYENTNDTAKISKINANIGIIYLHIKAYENAESYLQKSIQGCKTLKDKKSQIIVLDLLASAQKGQNKTQEAIVSTEQALTLAKEINDLYLIRACYESLYRLHEKLGNEYQASGFFDLYTKIDKQIKNAAINKIQPTSNTSKKGITAPQKTGNKEEETQKVELDETKKSLDAAYKLTREQQLKLEIQQMRTKEQELNAQEKIKQQIIITIFVLIVLAIVVFFLLLLLKQSNQTKKTNKLLQNSYQEIQLQKNKIEKQAHKIQDSIQYASRIQSAVLPQSNTMLKILPEYFIFFQPRDIVSGDFYWIAQKSNQIFIAVADCTGHGVPGAFMSLLGVTFLNEIVNKNLLSYSAGDILTQLRRNIMHSLHQKGAHDDSEDGMDIALTIIDQEQSKFQYAGANTPLYFIHNGKFKVLEPDIMPIGYQRKMEEKFSTQECMYSPGDIIYMCTDGYADQFGGENGKKFLTTRFQKMLIDNYKLSMDAQLKILQDNFSEWQGNHSQIDDILVLGIRLGSHSSKS